MEKPRSDALKINSGFFVLPTKAMDLVSRVSISGKGERLNGLAELGELSAHVNHGFWQPMDTLKEKNMLQQLWEDGAAPWKIC